MYVHPQIFTPLLGLMAPGWIYQGTAVAGDPPVCRQGGDRTRMVIGSGLMPVGIGSATNHGPGRVTIMDIGAMIPLMAGSGFRVRNGPRPGSPGGKRRITSAGHLVVRGV